MAGTLGLPSAIRACLFDLDGVLTQTARVHATAWKEMFDAFLRSRAEATGRAFEPFDAERDYHEYVDGKLRYDGVRSFLASRGIDLAEGDPGDRHGTETIIGLAVPQAPVRPTPSQPPGRAPTRRGIEAPLVTDT